MHNKAIKAVFFIIAGLILIIASACSQVQSAVSPSASQNNTASSNTTTSSASPSRSTPQSSSFLRPATTQPLIIIANKANTVKGSGTIAIAIDANLNFETGGKIARLNVKKGDQVSKSQLLAALDTTSLGVAMGQAQVNLDQAILAQTSASVALQTAQINLEKSSSVLAIKNVITNLEWQIKIAQMNASAAGVTSGDASFWSAQAKQYQKDLTAENKILTDFLSDSAYTGAVVYDVVGQPYENLAVQDMKMRQLQVVMAQQTLDRTQDAIDQAQRNLDLAQKQYNNTTIVAPFDGIVVTLNAKQGDVVGAPSPSQKPLIYMIDPTSMQIIVTINELDTPKLKNGQKATIKVDAFPGVTLQGTITDISLLPNLQGGVVNYDVTISFNVPPTTAVRAGMNASAEIAINQ